MKIKALILVSAFIFSAYAQVTNWANYTDQKNIRSAAMSSDGIWAASTGGAFFYNQNDNSYKTFHIVDGFSGSSLTSTAVDNKGRIWFGSTSGTIDMFDPATNTVKPILDIFNSNKQQKGINSFHVSGDSVFIATDFGVSVINTNTFMFVDTYSRFGSLSSNIKVNNIFKGNLIYVSVENAIAIQRAGFSNLSSPDAWSIHTVFHANLNRKINFVTEYNGSLLAATDYGVFIFDGLNFTPLINELISFNINKLRVVGNILYVISGTKLYKYDGQLIEVIDAGVIITDVFSSENGFYISTEDGILRIEDGQVSQVIKPNAPFANLFSSMTVDSKGNLWSATGTDQTGKGFYKLNSNEWINYNLATNPEILTNGYFNVYSVGDEVFFGSWGAGFLRIRDGQFTQYNASNTPMEGIENNPDFIVIGGISKDSKNNLWILNYASVTIEYLSMLTPDSTWYNFKIPSVQNQYIYNNFGLVVDQQDTKWFFSKSPNRPGLFFFHENNTFDNPNDDFSGYLPSNGLNGEILSLAVDRRGDIWIGTALGINVITNSSAALSSNPQFRISSIFSLRQQTINCIAVDPLNRKWIGTNQGLLLVNSDGSSLLESFDTRNSPLLANEIRSLVVDEETGIVYAGTDAGLIAFETSAKRPLDTFSELSVFPNPLIINNQNTLVTIDGLIKDTDIKILNINGKVVNQFSSPGGRVAYWDGRTLEGDYVNSGVYIIVASDKDGNSVKSAKVAVLKE